MFSVLARGKTEGSLPHFSPEGSQVVNVTLVFWNINMIKPNQQEWVIHWVYLWAFSEGHLILEYSSQWCVEQPVANLNSLWWTVLQFKDWRHFLRLIKKRLNKVADTYKVLSSSEEERKLHPEFADQTVNVPMPGQVKMGCNKNSVISKKMIKSICKVITQVM